MQSCLLAIESGMGVNAASREFGIPKPSIRRHRLGLNKFASGGNKIRGGPCALPKEVEDELVEHIKQLDELCFGITISDLRKLAFQLASAHEIHRFNEDKQSASKTWYYNFMKRHPDLSLRSPEATSLGRMKGFNREAVGDFFDKYYRLIEEHKLTADKIYNMDETGHSTVQVPSKVISVKGKKQVGAATSAERGTNTTGVYCHSAAGHFIPPMLIFKRKRMADSLKEDAPNGTVFACTNNGWIDSDAFLQWLNHFIKSVKASPDNKHLLLLDGHSSHTKNLKAIKLARDNGILMLSFPAHTTHRLQPLDVTFFKSLKNWYNIEIENHLRTTGKAVGVHLISRFVGKSLLKAATMEAAVNGFKKTGLWPPNRHVFHEEFTRMEAVLSGAVVSSDRKVQSSSTAQNVERTPEATSLEREFCVSDVNQTQPVPSLSISSAPPINSPSDSNSPLGPVSSGNKTIPVIGDGRCFFRSIAIALNPEFQSCKRNLDTGEIENRMTALHETAIADNLRSNVVAHMCKNVPQHSSQPTALLNADMPENLKFKTLPERILHMSSPQSMVGELEIKSTAEFLDRPVHVAITGSDYIAKYEPENVSCSKSPLTVKYTPHGDAGHYEAQVRAVQLDASSKTLTVSTLSKLFDKNQKASISSKSFILTSSPYKSSLEKKITSGKSVKRVQAVKKVSKHCKSKRQRPDASECDDDPSCIVCVERFSASKSREKWITCISCQMWAHLECTPNDGFAYICHFCDSDSE